MAAVWRALTHGASGFQRQVAVKRIDPKFRGYPEVVDMFVEEARVGALLSHPNIVQVHDFGLDETEQYYLVTELVEGMHVGDWVRAHAAAERRTPWPIVAAIGVEVLRALEAAHERVDKNGDGTVILHRDVTPGNILLSKSGAVKLADFGLAKAMDRAKMTRPNIVKGKLSYLAPELIQGAAPSVQSDLFSLGVVLWEVLSARRLFAGKADVDVYKLLQDPKVPLLNMTRPDLPIQLCRVVQRALSTRPEARFESARLMMGELTQALRVWPESADALAISGTFKGI